MKISVLFLVSYFTIVYSDGMEFSDEKNQYKSVARPRAKRQSLYKGKFVDASCELQLNLGGGVAGGSAVGGVAGAGTGAAIG